MAELLEKDLVYRIVGCAMAVHNQIGCGLREKTYERALCLEFGHRKVKYSQQSKYPVFYRGELVDEYIPDLEVENRVIVERKTVEAITDSHRGQLFNYLRVTGLKVGLIINFKHPKLDWERFVLDTAQQIAPRMNANKRE